VSMYGIRCKRTLESISELRMAGVKTAQSNKRTFNLSIQFMFGCFLLAWLFWLGRHNFLLFHSIAELFSIAVAWSVFLIIWNSRRLIQEDALLLVGIAYLFVGSIDLTHTLVYKGMGIFPGAQGANQSAQLWIIARYMESFSLLLFSFFTGRKIKFWAVLVIYSAIMIFTILSVFIWKNFPDCFIDGSGLTPFKKNSE